MYFNKYIKYKSKYNSLKKLQNGGSKNLMKKTVLDESLIQNKEEAEKIIDYMKLNKIPQDIQTNRWKYETLKDCYFVGHLNTDLDSVAGAIGAANLFSGTACLSENKVNTEIKWALKRWGFKLDDLIVIDKVKNLNKKKNMSNRP